MKKLFDLAAEMASVSRYSQSHLMQPESVLEHTGFVCLCALYICDRLVMAGENVSTPIVLARAVVHDMDEVITGDLPRPTKYDNEELTRLIHELEKRNMKIIADDVFESVNVYCYWRDAKENSKEGFIIRIADAFAVAYKAHREYKMYGNRSLRPHAKELKTNLLITMDKTDVYFENWRMIVEMIRDVISLCEEIENET